MSTHTVDTQRQTWTLDPAHSEVEFGVRYMMISTVKGHFTGVEGTIHLDEQDISDSSVDVTIDTRSIDTRNADRDAHLRSEDFFDVEHYPTIRFRSREIVAGGDGFRVKGDLTIRDVTREVVLDAEELGRGTDPWGNPRVAFRADTRISREEFGLTWNQALETGGVLVGDEIRLALEVQAIPAADESEDEAADG
jgi:polyisoprenoid-binding protein YceI